MKRGKTAMGSFAFFIVIFILIILVAVVIIAALYYNWKHNFAYVYLLYILFLPPFCSLPFSQLFSSTSLTFFNHTFLYYQLLILFRFHEYVKSTFGIDDGEDVVIGTDHLGGSVALSGSDTSEYSITDDSDSDK